MENLTIIKDTDEQLLLIFTDYEPVSGDTAVFKFARHWGDSPIKSIVGTIDADNKAFVFELPSTMTSSVVIERDLSEYVYEIEGFANGKKKVFKQGNLFIRNTI